MATSAATFSAEYTQTRTATRVPWTIWAGLTAVTSSMIGGTWDVSWHRSIGRDSFLTPAHVMIYACGVIAAVVCGYLILYTTFGHSQRLKSESVQVLGFRAPLGAFIAAWGGIAMLVSAPFDNWWHAAYGLDVKIISPPHTLLILGIRGVSIGVLFLVLAAMNRLRAAEQTHTLDASGTSSLETLRKIFLYIGGGTLIGQMFFLQEQTWDVVLHTTTAYIALGIGVPIVFAAYGLDVKIISPPHTLLILGIRGVSIGVLFLVLAAMNRLRAAEQTHTLDAAGTSALHTLQKIFLYIGGGTLIGQMFFLQEQTWDVVLHTTTAYIALGIGVPIVFAAFSRASGNRWASTICAAVYTAFILLEIQILPLVPATPKLGPVFFPVTHLVPAKFPVLVIVPAIALDLLWRRLRDWKPWQIALVSGVVFTLVIFAVEWPLANFLMSKASENRFFGTIYFDYNSRADGFDRMRRFFDPASGARLAIGLAWASACAFLSTWLGLFFGKWMRGVQR